MSNMLEYLRWRHDVPLTLAPFNEVDNLILSQLAYMPFDRIMDAKDALSLRLAAKQLLLLDPPAYSSAAKHLDRELLRLVGNSARFSNALVTNPVSEFDPSAQKQFAAVTFHLGESGFFVAFRGTDGTLVGWKEDFNMVFCDAVPAQLRAVEYLEQAVLTSSGCLRVGGHSKGGNLAVFSASNCSEETARRIVTVYNNDGPGLNDKGVASPGYLRIKDRIQCYLPQSSIIGMLLCPCGATNVIHSVNSGSQQHAPYSWEVGPSGFVREKGLNRRSIVTDRVLKGWADSFSPKERQVFFDTVYDVISATDATTVAALRENRLKTLSAMLAAAKGIDPESRKTVLRVIRGLFSVSAKNIKSKKFKSPLIGRKKGSQK